MNLFIIILTQGLPNCFDIPLDLLTSWISDGKTARSIIMYSVRQPPKISAAPTKADNLRTLIGIISAGHMS